MAQWYYGSGSGQYGPVEEAELRELIASGAIQPQTLVWRDGMAEWAPAQMVPELAGQMVSPYTVPMAPAGVGYYPTPTSGMAIASMVCGIVSLFLCYLNLLAAIPAVICGHMALSRINQSPVPVAGRGMAITGLVTGYLGLLFGLLWIGVFVFAMVSAAHSTPITP